MPVERKPRLVALALLVVAVLLMQVAIWRRGAMSPSPVPPPSPRPSPAVASSHSPSRVTTMAGLLSEYLRRKAAGREEPALLRQALEGAGPTRTDLPGMRSMRVFCQRTLALSPVEPLDAMQEVAWQRMYGPSSDPAPYLEYLVRHYDRDPGVRGLPEATRELSLEFFCTARTQRLAEHIDPHCPPLMGKTVADVGCGLGTFLPHLLRAVGPRGTVWAEDIDPSGLDFIAWAGAHGIPELQRVRRVLGGMGDVRLPKGAVDVVFLNDVHAVGFCEEFYGDRPRLGQYLSWMDSLKTALAPQGRVMLLETGTEGSIGLEGTLRLFSRGGFESRKAVRQGSGFLIELHPLVSPATRHLERL